MHRTLTTLLALLSGLTRADTLPKGTASGRAVPLVAPQAHETLAAGLTATLAASPLDGSNTRGRAAFQAGDYRTAAQQWKQARELASEAPAERAAAAANLASLEYSRGDARSALVGYREALGLWEQAGPDSPGMRITLRHLADVLRLLGEHQEARQVLSRLSSVLEGDATPDADAFARLQLSRARLESATGQIATASSLYRHLVASSPADASVRAAAWDGLGEVCLIQGKLVEADQAIREALALWDSLGQTIRVAGTANRLGDRWLSARRPRQALPYLQRALAILEARGVTGAQLASTLNNLGQAYRFSGQAKLAAHYFDEARAVAVRDLGADHPILASILLNCGDFAFSRKKYAEAERYLRQALAIDELRLSHHHPDVARDVARLARLHVRRKQYDEACQELGEALAIRERSQLPLDTEQADWFELRASLLRRSENYAEAAQLEAKAMRIRVQQALH